jgi:hypothetical protein
MKHEAARDDQHSDLSPIHAASRLERK